MTEREEFAGPVDPEIAEQVDRGLARLDGPARGESPPAPECRAG